MKFCKERITEITCQLITVEEVNNVRQNYKREGKTILGKRNVHQFYSHKGSQIIKCKHTSFDKNCALLFNLLGLF